MFSYVWKQSLRILGQLFVSEQVVLPVEGSLVIGQTTIKTSAGDSSHPALSRVNINDGNEDYTIALLTSENQIPSAHLTNYVTLEIHQQLLQRVSELEQFVENHFN